MSTQAKNPEPSGMGFMYKMLALSCACYAGKLAWDKHDSDGQLTERLATCVGSGFAKCELGAEGMLTLTNTEKNAVIKKYVESDQRIATKEDCLIGVGYNACTDINFRASDLIALIEPEIVAMEKKDGKKVVAQVHSQISTLREFIETFAYQFQHGANAERVSSSKELFDFFLSTLRGSELPRREELGGHSPVWATRAQREGCKVFIAAQSTPVIERQLPLDEDANKLLIWPKAEIEKAGPQSEEKKAKIDLHLVFEYAEGDTILSGRFKAPRSNRFYFVHDPNGGKLKQLEVYHKIAKDSHPEIKRHMFGGYQLLQRLEHAKAEERLSKQAELWKEMRKTGDHRIHVEFADFNGDEFFRLFEKHVVRNANSLGMNEQELLMLLEYWKDGHVAGAKNSKPSFQDILNQLKEFFEKQKQEGLDINRVHLHPYGSFFMCYDRAKWHDAHDAIVKSSIAVPKYCIAGPAGQQLTKDHLDDFELGDLPPAFDHPNRPGEKIYLRKDTLTYDFELNDDIYCYLQFFIKCKRVFKTAGMGDTISGTGFIYHVPK